MRNAFALLGVGFMVIVVGTYVLLSTPANAPERDASLADTTSRTMLTLTSPAFSQNEMIPLRYSCDGEGISPELQIAGVPEEAVSLALVVTDPDIPEEVKSNMGIDEFTHWVLFNIPPTTTVIEEGGSAGISGLNSRMNIGYTGPCPPRDMEPKEHRYIFSLYALDRALSLSSSAEIEEVEEALLEHILEKAELVGRYTRNQE